STSVSLSCRLFFYLTLLAPRFSLFPYTTLFRSVRSGFDSIRVNVSNMDLDGDEFRLEGFASIGNFMVNHPKIARKDVVIKNAKLDRKSTRLNSSHVKISYAVFCLKKKKILSDKR